MTIFGYNEFSKKIIQISSVTIYFIRKTKPKPTAPGTFKISDVAHVVLILLLDSTRLNPMVFTKKPYDRPIIIQLLVIYTLDAKKEIVTLTSLTSSNKDLVS